MRPGGIYDAGNDEALPEGMTGLHFDVFKTARRKRRNLACNGWPEFFEPGDVSCFDALFPIMRFCSSAWRILPEALHQLVEKWSWNTLSEARLPKFKSGTGAKSALSFWSSEKSMKIPP